MKPSISYHIDLTGHCNLKCECCPMGRREEYSTKEVMSRSMLCSIIEKAKAESNPLGVWMYNFTEPFLHPHLQDMIDEVHAHGLKAHVSTNLNLSRNLREVMETDLEMLMISVSGFTQETYAKTHTAGQIQEVFDNMVTVAAHRKNTHVRVHWHQYKSNAHEESLMKAHSDKMRFDFRPYKAVAMPLDDVIGVFRGGLQEERHKNLLLDLKDASRNCLERKKWACDIQRQMVSIDSSGNLRLCCSIYKPGLPINRPYLETPLKDFLTERLNSSTCRGCKAVGGHIYASEWSETPLHSIKDTMIRTYRKSPFKFPKLSSWLRRRLFEGR